jgi:hypothetical protein
MSRCEPHLLSSPFYREKSASWFLVLWHLHTKLNCCWQRRGNTLGQTIYHVQIRHSVNTYPASWHADPCGAHRHWAYRRLPLWFYCDVFVDTMQVSYSQPDVGFFLRKCLLPVLCCCRFLKNSPALNFIPYELKLFEEIRNVSTAFLSQTRGKMVLLPENRLCSLRLWRVHEIKRMYLASRTHGLFIT